MHFILGVLGTVVTILILLNRLADAGIGLGGLNPFLWKRRRDWENQYSANPIFSVSSPMEATALLLTATAKIDGEISNEQKRFLLDVFENDFHRPKNEAAGLLTSSSYLLGDGLAITKSLDRVLKPSLPNFSESQAESAVGLLTRLCELDNESSELRAAFVERITALLVEPFNDKGKWV